MFKATLINTAMGIWLLAEVTFGGVQASVSWEAPRFNTDGTIVTNLAFFKIHYGTASGAYTSLKIVTNSPTVITDLAYGQRYYVAVSAVNQDGVESARSEERTWDTPPATQPAQLALSTQAVSWVAILGEPGVNASFDIWNAGGNTMAYHVANLPAWLACTPATGTSSGERDTVTLHGDAPLAGLGQHEATITVSAQEVDAPLQTQNLHVALTVQGRFYRDTDGDGFGSTHSVLDVSKPAGYVVACGDLDDSNPLVHPGATELRNGFDDDCDGMIDEDFIPVASLDFDGDVRADVATFDPNTGVWNVRGSNGRNATLAFGYSATIPVAEDFDGDLVSDYALFAPGEGRWYLTSSATGGVSTVMLGDATSLPIPADYDGDGKADPAVFNPATRQWTVQPSGGGATRSGKFGGVGAVPAPADYDGDGMADVAVFDPVKATWSGIRSSDNKRIAAPFGSKGGLPVPADYDGDGLADAATYLPATGVWQIRESAARRVVSKSFGWSGTVPVPGDYDGDGLTDLCLYEAASGTWYTRFSSGGETQLSHGGPGQQPVAPQYQINRMLGLCL